MSSPGQQTGAARQSDLAAFGLSLRFDVAPPGAWQARTSREAGVPDEASPLGAASLPSLEIRSSVSTQAIEDSWSGLREIGWEGVIDGAPFVVERGVAGDHRFVHGAHPGRHGIPSGGTPADETRAIHHLSPDAGILQCAPADPADPSWWRVVLDSVLFTVALLQGYEALHAGAVATADGVIAITAASGGGKSTLLSELLGRGLALMADDVLVLEPGDFVVKREDSEAGRGDSVAHPRGTDFSLSTPPPFSPVTYPAPPLMTVPSGRIPILGERNLGESSLGGGNLGAGNLRESNYSNTPEIICSVDDEYWVAVPVYSEPLPLKTLVVLDRQPGLKLSLEKIEDPLAPLMGSLMNFPRSPERQRTRFEFASILAAKTTLWRLTADMDTTPEALADTLLAG